MTFAVELPIGRTLDAAIERRRNANVSARPGGNFNKVVIVVAFVGNQSLELETFNQPDGLCFIVSLAARQDKAQRQSESVNRQMNFR